jgi:hypothetical protein
MLRKVFALLFSILVTLTCAGQTQTPRQALIEMFTARDQKAFERHLPKIMQQRIAAITSGSSTGFSASPQTLNAAFGRKNNLRWFETGPVLLVMQDANSRLEVKVERENLQAERDDIDLSFKVTTTGQTPNFGNGTRIMLTMQKEEGIWRLSEFGLTFRMKLDGSFLEAMARQMNLMTKTTMPASAVTAEPVPVRKMSAEDLSAPEKAALNSLQQLLTAQKEYRAANPSIGFTCDPESLSAKEISGYRTMIVGCKGNPTSSYKITLTPAGMMTKGWRSFCADESGVARYSDDGQGISCLSEHNQIEP